MTAATDTVTVADLGWVDPAPTTPRDEAKALLRQVHEAAYYSTSRAVPRHTLNAIARYLGEVG